MRLTISLKSAGNALPFSYQHELAAAIHRWIGHNSLHGRAYSPLSFGLLVGLQRRGDYLFAQEAGNVRWWVGCWDEQVIERLIEGIHADSHAAFGMRVSRYNVQERQRFRDGRRVWFVETPIVLRRKRLGKADEYVMWDAFDANHLLTSSLRKKMEANGVNADIHSARFDTKYAKAKSKLIQIADTRVRGSLCPVIVDADALAHEFIWAAGIGALTGMGFGAAKD